MPIPMYLQALHMASAGFKVIVNLTSTEEKKLKKIIFPLTLITASIAFAGPECTKEDKSKWQDKAKFEKSLVDQGYKVKVFKITKGNCYELYGRDKAGKKVEIYFNPITGAKVKEEIH
jgi:hypothetical protein